MRAAFEAMTVCTRLDGWDDSTTDGHGMSRPVQQLEELVRARWLDDTTLPYRQQGTCATCGRSRTDDKPLTVCGVNLDSLVCIYCFEFEHDCKPPNYRRRKQAA